MKRAAISLFALLMTAMALASAPAQAQIFSPWGRVFGLPEPSQFPNSWGWDWGHPVGSAYGPGPYGGYGYYSPFGIYEYSFNNPMNITGTMYGWTYPRWY